MTGPGKWYAALRIPGAALLFLIAGAAVYFKGTEILIGSPGGFKGTELLKRVFRISDPLKPAGVADAIWFTGLVLTAAIPVWRTVRDMLKGLFAADVVAILAILSAAALYQPFAGLVVVIMLTGGAALER